MMRYSKCTAKSSTSGPPRHKMGISNCFYCVYFFKKSGSGAPERWFIS
jgi:hypothetical protein